MSRNAIVTICNGRFYEKIGEISHPTFVDYARKLNADFIVWRSTASHRAPHYQKCEIAYLLKYYDRILYIDTDIIIRPDTPSIFEIVPENCIGMFEEGKFFDRKKAMEDFLNSAGIKKSLWNGRYFNSGVIVASKQHSEFFYSPGREMPDQFWDQSWFNLVFSNHKVPMFSLPHQWNRMILMEPFVNRPRFSSFFIHYAGLSGLFPENEFLHLMRSDLDILKASHPYYDFKDIQISDIKSKPYYSYWQPDDKCPKDKISSSASKGRRKLKIAA